MKRNLSLLAIIVLAVMGPLLPAFAQNPPHNLPPPGPMLGRADIQDDLGISPEVAKKIEDMSPDWMQLMMAHDEDQAKEISDKLLALLTDAQRKRLEQIRLGVFGGTIVANSPELQKQLGMSKSQLDKLEEMFAGKPGVYTRDLMTILTPEQQQLFKEMCGEELAHAPRTTILPDGALAPDFVVYKPNGDKVHLSDYRGKVVVIDFWATWCGPCLAGMPHLQVISEKTTAKNVVVLAVNVLDTKAAFDAWIPKNKKYTFNCLLDPAGRGRGSVASLYGVSALPVRFVIGTDGKIAGSTVGEGAANSARPEPTAVASADEKQPVDKILEKLGITY
jgi:thiol-disulfide isomerase/thioredoxin